ncbi:MAG: hypothetical protein IPH45_09550 [Bacteroidales bacterium]|nr:hypothetical protein [Bacteroidales bacterium]
MDKVVPSNFVKSSNIIFLSIGLGMVSFLLREENLSQRSHLYISLTSWILLAGIGLLIRKGYNWVKYLMLLLTIINIYSISLIFQVVNDKLLSGILGVAPLLIQVWATVILFIPPSDSEN